MLSVYDQPVSEWPRCKLAAGVLVDSPFTRSTRSGFLKRSNDSVRRGRQRLFSSVRTSVAT